MRIGDRKIIIYGAGFLAEKFFCMNSQYKIEFVIDRRIRSFHGIRCYRLDEVTERLTEHSAIVVVTGVGNSRNEMMLSLERLGLREELDYTLVENFNKELAILYGNCHMEIIERFLRMAPSFSDHYFTKMYFVGHDSENERWPDKGTLKKCKLFISQYIRDDNSQDVPGHEILSKMCDKAVCVIIPNLYGINMFFPQIPHVAFLPYPFADPLSYAFPPRNRAGRRHSVRTWNSRTDKSGD